MDPDGHSPEPLRIQGLRKDMGNFVLEAELEVLPGQRAVIFGRSGSGKTTLLRWIAGLEELVPGRDRGEVWIGEQEITRLSPEDRGIGFVFQEQALFPAMSVLENAAFGLKMRGRARKEREEVVMAWLRRIGLEGQCGTPVGKLSGGERQRLAFVRAVVWKPRVLLLDEPFSALDPELRARLRSELMELHALWPVPLLMVTHDEADVHSLATLRIHCEEGPGSQSRKFMNAPTIQR